VISLRRPPGLGLAVAALVAALAATSGPALGQSTTSLLVSRAAEYRAAADAHQAALSAFFVVDQAFTAALEEVSRARREGDDAALDVALPRAQELSGPKAAADRRVREAADDLADKRRALIEILIVRHADLVGQVDAASNAQQRQQLGRLLDDVSNQLSEMEEEAGDPTGLLPVVMPDISISPRDLPAEIISKAQILERYAELVDTVLIENAAQIAELQDRLLTQRQRQDFLNDRFGDRVVPTGPPRLDPSVQVADSTDSGGRPITLEERLAAAQAYREELIGYRDQLLIRAQVFRQTVRRRS
jgi:hypothetical protein